MPRPTLLLGWAVSLLAAGLAGVVVASRPAPAPVRAAAAPLPPSRVRSGPIRQVVAGGLDAGDVRAILREELDSRPGALAAGDPTCGQPPEAPPPSPERQQAAERAHALVAAAVGRGAWTTDDRDALRAQLPLLDRQDAAAVLSELVPALNEGRVRYAYRGTPF